MPIKFFDFLCENGHRFEGSFASVKECERQLKAGLVRCPLCDTDQVRKVPSATHLAAKSTATQELSEADRARLQEVREKLMTAIRKAAEKAEDVGDNFAQEARRIQRGQAPARAVKGTCSSQQARELLEEGITVLPVPESSGKTLN